MGRANKLVFMLVLAAIFAYSGCSGRHNPPPGGGEQFSLTIALPADIAMPLPGWLNHLGGRAPKNRVREIIPYSNCIDIYVYNPNDPTDNTKITRNLVDEKTPIPVNCTVNSTGPYTIEVFASAVIDADLSICFTAEPGDGGHPGQRTSVHNPGTAGLYQGPGSGYSGLSGRDLEHERAPGVARARELGHD